ncbi:MAG: hypothetical protein QOK21_2486 [Solirubrobacteraceae bacterium]|jgi:selenocysteine lyase/cysteine desulfurase|nr:hypothetical protein [Solirubrobacteraceae bacterium]
MSTAASAPTAIERLAAQCAAPPGYLDTATVGVPPAPAVRALGEATRRWATGTLAMDEIDRDVARARAAFGRLVGVPAASVAIGAQVSTLLAPVAASLRPGTRVLVAEGDFTSLLWPFAVQQARGVRLRVVEHGDLIDAIDATTDVVAVSAVQSATGTPVDLDRLAGAADAHGARVVLDATQAAGWAELDAGRFSHVVVSAYKWLLCPRGVAFLTVRDADVDPDLLAHGAGWYAGEDPWATCYGTELRLAADARRFDASPAWALWGAAAESLEAIAAVGVAPIAAHDLALAARLRDAAGLPPMTSPIVRVERPNVAARLAQAGIAAAVRGGASRLAVHLYTTGDDIDRALAALAAG